MRLRTALLAVLAATALGAAPSGAAARCPFLVDPAGDAQTLAKPVADDPALDFVSADIASDATRLTVVMRVVELRLPPPGSPVSVLYEYGFRVDGVSFLLRAKYSVVTGKTFSLTTQQETDGGIAGVYVFSPTDARVDGVFDEDLSEIRMTVALEDLEAVRGQRVSGHRLISWLQAEEFIASSDFLEAPGKRYVVGDRGCVSVGA